MKKTIYSRTFLRIGTFLFAIATFCLAAGNAAAQSSPKAIYDQINAFTLNGGQANVSGLTLKRDRVAMTFTGTFYFTAPVEGRVTGAVFIGQGTLRADVPPNIFEKANVKRLLGAENVTSTFTSAVMRFTDDTFSVVGASKQDGAASPEAQKLAAEFELRMRKESGANIAERVTVSVLNGEKPGFFFANFAGGDRDRFSYVFDPQGRIPTTAFGINGGEKGLIYAYKPSISTNEVWMAFYSEDDYAKQMVTYSDAYDLVDITKYNMEVDLRNPKSKMGLRTKIEMHTLANGVRAIPFSIGESLGESDDSRLKKQMRFKSAKLAGKPLEFIQEDWEGGAVVLLPEAMAANKPLEIEIELEGDFLRQSPFINDVSFPRSNESWYPRHGFLDRATYEFTYLHAKKHKVASVGVRESESAWPEDKDVVVTKYKMAQPVALVTFALGPWERHPDTIKWDSGEKPIPLEFNSMPGSYLAIKESFILAELNNSVRYFHQLFGAYPYETYSATFHPYGFGQGFPTMLMIPPADRANKYTYAFISHETAHQWWGNIVAWRSYRDQWLSEGFAEYSGVLYTALRENPKASRNLIDQMRDSLKLNPETQTGRGSGRLNDIGPIILGHRLETSKSFGTYTTLIYNKGALVLRMLHFLLSDPNSGDDKAFFDMMKDFVARYRDKTASTDDFRLVANEHFAKSPIGKKYNLTDLNWFFRQWVYQTDLPAYKLEYSVQTNPDGTAMVSGNVLQDKVPETFFTPLPLVIFFDGERWATGTVHAYGPKTPFQIKLPTKPVKVELDPHHWILSEKTETK